MAEQTPGKVVTTYDLAVSNMVSIEAMVRILVRKGLLTREEMLQEVVSVKADMAKGPGHPGGLQ